MGDIFFQDVSSKTPAFSFNAEAVKNSIRNFFYTIKGSLPTDPNYGSSIYEMVFAPMDATIQKIYLQKMISELYNYEKRITIVDAEMTQSLEYGRVNIILVFVINGTDPDTSKESLKLTFNQ